MSGNTKTQIKSMNFFQSSGSISSKDDGLVLSKEMQLNPDSGSDAEIFVVLFVGSSFGFWGLSGASA